VNPKYRVVNLTGQPVHFGDLIIREGENYFDTLIPKEIYFVNNTERVFTEKFCLKKEKYVPFHEAITTIEPAAEQAETESETETTDSTDDSKEKTETEPANPFVNLPSDNLPEIPEDRDPKLVELLNMTNDKGSDEVKDIEDKDFLQAIIDAPDVKSGTRSAAIRRLNFLNVD
jgi:hypothetical protein